MYKDNSLQRNNIMLQAQQRSLEKQIIKDEILKHHNYIYQIKKNIAKRFWRDYKVGFGGKIEGLGLLLNVQRMWVMYMWVCRYGDFRRRL